MNDDTRITRAIVGALRVRDLSGFELWRWLGRVHGAQQELTEATLYPTLYRLEAEDVIEGYWREDDRTRRAYRIRSRGVVTADARGWARIAPRRAAGRPQSEPERDENLEPLVWGAEGLGGGTAAPEDGAARRIAVMAAAELETDPEWERAASLKLAWLTDLVGRLRLDDLTTGDVRTELADHIDDSTRQLRADGFSTERATATTIAAFGPVDDLARGINAAQRTGRRLLWGLPWPLAIAPLTAAAAFALAFAFTTIVFVGITRLLIPALAAVNVHLYIADTGELHMQEVAFSACVGAFVSGRRSVESLSLRSRRSTSTIAPAWAAIGGLGYLCFVLLGPFPIHPMATLVMLASPLFFVAGTLRPEHLVDETTTRRGLAAAAAMCIVGSFLPGVHLWAYDPGRVAPAAPPIAADPGPISFLWLRERNAETGTVETRGVDATRWHDVRVELWPTVRDGPILRPDNRATRPGLLGPDFGKVQMWFATRSVPDWQVLVTAVGTDGVRRTLHSEVQLGNPTHLQQSILFWLLDRL